VDKRGLQMQTSALLRAKNFGLFKTYDVSVWTRGSGIWASVNILQTREGGVNFLQIPFMDSL